MLFQSTTTHENYGATCYTIPTTSLPKGWGFLGAMKPAEEGLPVAA